MEATASVSRSGFQEQGSDSRVVADRFCDLVYVYSGYVLGDVGDGVDVTDLCSEERIAGVLDQLSRLGSSSDDWRKLGPIEPSIESSKLIRRLFVIGPDDKLVRMESVIDGRALL